MLQHLHRMKEILDFGSEDWQMLEELAYHNLETLEPGCHHPYETCLERAP
jgi:hypothetical protein